MKNFKNRKSGMLLIAVVLLLVIVVGGTVAYLATSTDPIVNTFIPGKVPPEITEDFDGNVKQNVAIKNDGNIDAYIRVKVIFTWQDANGNVYGTLPKEGTDYTLTWVNTGWDTETTDGFCYYTTPVAANGTTGVLFTNCRSVAANEPEGYDLHVEILAQSIQAEPISVVTEKWGVTVNGTTISK